MNQTQTYTTPAGCRPCNLRRRAIAAEARWVDAKRAQDRDESASDPERQIDGWR